MNRRIILLINTVAAVALQAIPNTVIEAWGTENGPIYMAESLFDIRHLWGIGALFYPPATLCCVAAVLFALLYLLRGRRGARITLLVLSAVTVLLLSFPIYLMLADPNRFSVVIVLITLLALTDVILCAIPEKQ